MTETKNQKQTRENPRTAIREARAKRLRVIEGQQPKTIKVFAANETMRGVLRHHTGTRFRDKLDQGVEWPNDSFTKRRLAEGSVLTEASSGGEPVEPDPAQNPREHAEAFKPKKRAEPAEQAEPAEPKESNGRRSPKAERERSPEAPAT
jgi:hypothetical protein